MLLVIPAIGIKGGRCVQMVRGAEGSPHSDDPVEMAKLWRKENAKSLHVTDVDGALEGRLVNFDVIQRMVRTVDIPIELGGGLRSFDEAKRAFTNGVYRVVLGTLLIENPDDAKRILDAYGASKVVVGLDAENGIVRIQGRKSDSGLIALSVALNAKALGFRRLVYRDISTSGTTGGPNINALQFIAQNTGMRVTSSGGVRDLKDLLLLQELEMYGVDSVVVGHALYENKFSCQGLWRLCEAGNFPYTAKI